MKIVFISNILSPHQIPLCDEWIKLGVKLSFIETANIDKESLPIGWKFTGTRDYLIDFTTYSTQKELIRNLILEADAVILGSAPKFLLEERLKRDKLTFIYSERIYKNFKDILKWPYHILKFNKIYGHSNNLYLLCASAFSSADYQRIGCFKNKAFKWGYFTNVEEFNFEASYVSKQGNIAHLMWCARFLALKHPELPVKMAYRLKNKGYNFTLDMFGSGEELEKTISLSQSLGLQDIVSFKGNLPNAEILQKMRKHDIFLFTSDRNEGWGAVANEAMSNGCVLVGSSSIGSVPFLIEDGINGCIFQTESINSLTATVEWLFNHPKERKVLALNAYNTMRNLWSPKQAAERFLYLVDCLSLGKKPPFSSGPCSEASPLSNKWYKNRNK